MRIYACWNLFGCYMNRHLYDFKFSFNYESTFANKLRHHHMYHQSDDAIIGESRLKIKINFKILKWLFIKWLQSNLTTCSWYELIDPGWMYLIEMSTPGSDLNMMAVLVSCLITKRYQWWSLQCRLRNSTHWINTAVCWHYC